MQCSRCSGLLHLQLAHSSTGPQLTLRSCPEWCIPGTYELTLGIFVQQKKEPSSVVQQPVPPGDYFTCGTKTRLRQTPIQIKSNQIKPQNMCVLHTRYLVLVNVITTRTTGMPGARVSLLSETGTYYVPAYHRENGGRVRSRLHALQHLLYATTIFDCNKPGHSILINININIVTGHNVIK